MNLPVNIDPDLTYSAKLPHHFLNHLLECGYQFDQGVLCLKITGVFGHCYCGMTEFKPAILGCTVDISYEINRFLNLITGEYVHIERVEPQIPHMIRVQGHRDSFSTVVDLKEQLEQLLVTVKVLTAGIVLTVNGSNGPESLTVTEILDAEGSKMEWGLTVETDIEVDFMKTKETIERELKEEKEREEREHVEELERQGYKGPGYQVGAGNGIDRQAWIDQLQAKINKT